MAGAAHVAPTAELRHRKQREAKPLPPPPAFISDDPLMTAREAAAYRRQGLSTFWRDVRNGTVPKPIYITPKAPRWRLSDLRAAMGKPA